MPGRHDYNQVRPHSPDSFMPPAAHDLQQDGPKDLFVNAGRQHIRLQPEVISLVIETEEPA